MPDLELVSHHLCPFVQRAAIVLAEKGAPFTRTYVDLAHKPDWFLAISPLGKVPLLRVDGADTIFESAVICEYLDETIAPRLHPEPPLQRARERSFAEFASATLNDISGLYNALDAGAFEAKLVELRRKFAYLERALDPAGPWFAGARFGIVDAAFGPVFRYFDVIDAVLDERLTARLPRLAAWRAALSARPSVRNAVAPDYPDRLRKFLETRGAHVSRLLARIAEREAVHA
jgi:glutathione S-transferase